MRLELAILFVVALPGVVDAQPRRPVAVGASASLPPIGLPLPQIGLPLPSIGLAQAIDPLPSRDDRRSPPSQNPHRSRGGRKGVHAERTVFYVLPAYGWDDRPVAQPTATTPEFSDDSSRDQVPSGPTGILRLDVQPSGIVQLYVDGYFIGTPDDSSGELTLDAGSHKIEFRAPGYETTTLDVRIAPGRTITYKGTLSLADANAAPEPTIRPPGDDPVAPKPVYFIPGCYMGNVPPKDAGLPATCDQSRVTTFQR